MSVTPFTSDAPDVTDDADDDDAKGVMIALLPVTSDWCQIDLPHMTLVYAGTTDDISPLDFNDIAKDAASLAMLADSAYLRVLGYDVFGTDPERVNVLKLLPTPELLAMRRFVEHWNASEFPFSPHCTIGPVGTPLPEFMPRTLAFDKVLASYGTDNMIFRMDPS